MSLRYLGKALDDIRDRTSTPLSSAAFCWIDHLLMNDIFLLLFRRFCVEKFCGKFAFVVLSIALRKSVFYFDGLDKFANL